MFGREIEIPEEWEILNLTDKNILNLSSGESNKEIKENGTFPVYGSNGILGYSEKFNVEECILIGRVGASGSIHILKNKAWVTDNVLIAKIDVSVDKQYCFYTLIFLNLGRFATKTAQPLLTQSILKIIKIIVPPLSEQQKIASILSGVDAMIESTRQVVDRAERLKKGLLQKLLTKGLGHKKFKNIFLKYRFLKFYIPDTWEIENVKQLSTLKKESVLTGPFGLMLHSSDYVSEGTPLILIKNIQNGRIVDDDIPKISDKDVQRLSRYMVKEGDIIFSRVGRVGSSVLIEKKHSSWLFSGQTLRIRFENPELSSKYVNYYFHSSLFNKVLIPELLGATRDSINTKILEQFPIIIPTKKEQAKIASILSGVDASSYVQLIINARPYIIPTILLILFTATLRHEFYNTEKNIHSYHNS